MRRHDAAIMVSGEISFYVGTGIEIQGHAPIRAESPGKRFFDQGCAPKGEARIEGLNVAAALPRGHRVDVAAFEQLHHPRDVCKVRVRHIGGDYVRIVACRVAQGCQYSAEGTGAFHDVLDGNEAGIGVEIWLGCYDDDLPKQPFHLSSNRFRQRRSLVRQELFVEPSPPAFTPRTESPRYRQTASLRSPAMPISRVPLRRQERA